MVRMGTLPFEPFDEELFGALVPHCKIIASGSAGYNEFHVDWMTRNKIWFCNTRNAVSEATADMSMFLILAVLKNATVAERSAREGGWKDGLVPTKDPRDLTLGIVGMGSIGKVYIYEFCLTFGWLWAPSFLQETAMHDDHSGKRSVSQNPPFLQYDLEVETETGKWTKI